MIHVSLFQCTIDMHTRGEGVLEKRGRETADKEAGAGHLHHSS